MTIKTEKLIYIIDIDNSIEKAWEKIERNRHRSVIVIENAKIVGTVSDGDLRKAILSHRLLSTPIKDVMNVNFVAITEEKQGNALSICKQRDIFLLPIVDNEMNLIDIYEMSESAS